jgi:hypothetical protein
VIAVNDGHIGCNNCGASSVPDEDTARREGWLVDENVSPWPTVHFCTTCVQRMERRHSR